MPICKLFAIKKKKPTTTSMTQELSMTDELSMTEELSMTQELSKTQGLHVDRIDELDTDFITYAPHFNGHLKALYKIQYNLPPPMKASLEDSPMTTVYFHGTGHCGCVLQHLQPGPSSRVAISDWCPSHMLGIHCSTHGILTSGHLLTYSRQGHFFSPNMTTAMGYAQNKSGHGMNALSLFICKTQNTGPLNNIMSVRQDTDILPVYLAIVNNHI